MDSPSDNSSYLKYFDRSQSFLLQSTDEPLEVQDPCLQVEPMFTEIDGSSAWPVEGLSILLNGSLISETPMELDGDKGELNGLYEDQLQEDPKCGVGGSVSYPIVSEVPGKGYVTSEGLFLPNELLLQLNFQTEDNLEESAVNPSLISETEVGDANQIEVQGNDVVTLNYEVNECDTRIESGKQTAKVIELLNTDGSVISLKKCTPVSVNKGKSFEDLFELVKAHKCKLCSYLCESLEGMVQHLETTHCRKTTNGIGATKNGQIVKEKDFKVKSVQMKSVLNVNQTNKEVQQTVYLCSQCNMGYSTKSSLKKHMVTKHKLVYQSTPTNAIEPPQPSTEVTKPSTDPTPKQPTNVLLSLVKKQQTVSKKVKCSFVGCEVRIASEELRLRHEECHDDGQKKQFKCPKCGEKFSAWRICSSHLWKCHGEDMGLLVCPVCLKFKAFSFGRMKTHMAIHNDECPFICHECGKGFKQFSQLKNHQLVHLDAKIDKVPDWASQKQCEKCQKYFANSKTLKKHIQFVHNKFKPFICNICGHKTSRKAMLDLHLRQHTGEKPHQCTVCPYKTGDPNCLRKHVMRHEGSVKYTCPHCDYQSIQSTAYKNHLSSKHPGKGGSYYCTICSFHTVSETTYYTHKREHEINANELNSSEKEPPGSTCGQIASVVNVNNSSNSSTELQDDETQNCFLNMDNVDEAIDTGGITIPAGYELQVSL